MEQEAADGCNDLTSWNRNYHNVERGGVIKMKIMKVRKGTSKNPKLCCGETDPKCSFTSTVNSAFGSVASLDFGVFRGSRNNRENENA